MNLPSKMKREEAICKCYQVNEATIRAAIEKDNLTKIDHITENCEAGGGCYSYHIIETLMHDNAQKVKKGGI
jgi:NAD(P)H-nitrite reductase large subunit